MACHAIALPYVAQVGIFGRPTLVHNIETLHWIARCVVRARNSVISRKKWPKRPAQLLSFRARGQTRMYLLPAGSTILDIIEAAGGMAKGHQFKAYQPGGHHRVCYRPA